MTYRSQYKPPTFWTRVRQWDGWEFLCLASLCIGGAVLFLGLVFGGINIWGRAIERGECDKWAQTSGYTVRWQDNSFWSYDCMAKTQSGKWLPIDQLREVDR